MDFSSSCPSRTKRHTNADLPARRNLETTVSRAFTKARTERDLLPLFRAHPLLIRNALNVHAWNHVDVLPEFRLGSDYRVDYLILSAHSGAWHAVLVETKSHRAKLFTKRGTPGKELALALLQLDDIERWIKRDEAAFRAIVAKHFKRRRNPAHCSRADIHTRADTEILDYRTCFSLHYKVLIGRSSEFDTEDQERRASFYARGREIVTYDRVLGVAQRLDQAARESALAWQRVKAQT